MAVSNTSSLGTSSVQKPWCPRSTRGTGTTLGTASPRLLPGLSWASCLPPAVPCTWPSTGGTPTLQSAGHPEPGRGMWGLQPGTWPCPSTLGGGQPGRLLPEGTGREGAPGTRLAPPGWEVPVESSPVAVGLGGPDHCCPEALELCPSPTHNHGPAQLVSGLLSSDHQLASGLWTEDTAQSAAYQVLLFPETGHRRPQSQIHVTALVMGTAVVLEEGGGQCHPQHPRPLSHPGPVVGLRGNGTVPLQQGLQVRLPGPRVDPDLTASLCAEPGDSGPQRGGVRLGTSSSSRACRRPRTREGAQTPPHGPEKAQAAWRSHRNPRQAGAGAGGVPGRPGVLGPSGVQGARGLLGTLRNQALGAGQVQLGPPRPRSSRCPAHPRPGPRLREDTGLSPPGRPAEAASAAARGHAGL